MIARLGYAVARMGDRMIIAAAAAVLCALTMAACGGSGNGVASQGPNQIIDRATSAIDGVSSVRVTGAVASGSPSTTIRLDLELVAGRGATGSMSEDGLSFRLVTLGDNAYINATTSFWEKLGGSAAARLLQGKWLRAPTTTGQFASFASLTNVRKLLAGVLSGHGALTRGPATTIAGQKVIALKDASKDGVLYVATTGKPYPIQISNSGTNGGQLTFSRFDKPVDLTAPAHSIDISKLGK